MQDRLFVVQKASGAKIRITPVHIRAMKPRQNRGEIPFAIGEIELLFNGEKTKQVGKNNETIGSTTCQINTRRSPCL